jgi:uncharacterized protein involved in exopolysaccharide biosynthesis
MECDLLTVFDTESLEEATRELRNRIQTRVSPEGIISVAVTVSRPELAAEIANTLIQELDRFNRETSMTMGKRQRVFLEERLTEVRDQLSEAENALRAFQEEHHTVSLTDQVSEAIIAAAHLKAEIVAKEVQLGVLERFATGENPQVRTLQFELHELREKLQQMEYGQDQGKDEKEEVFGPGFSVPFAELPGVGLELARLTREARIQEEVYGLLTQRYEQARIAEVKDTPTVQVLDRAKPPERRSFPQRKRMVVIAGILSLFVGTMMAFFFEYVEQVKKRPDEYRDWGEIFGQLRGDLRRAKSILLRR